MTPIEIFEYKQKWMSSGYNYPVQIHSDYRSQALDYCSKQLLKQEWAHKKWTDVYEDTFFFESLENSNNFEIYFKKILSR